MIALKMSKNSQSVKKIPEVCSGSELADCCYVLKSHTVAYSACCFAVAARFTGWLSDITERMKNREQRGEGEREQCVRDEMKE